MSASRVCINSGVKPVVTAPVPVSARPGQSGGFHVGAADVGGDRAVSTAPASTAWPIGSPATSMTLKT